MIGDGIRRYHNWFARSIPMTPQMRVRLQRLRGVKIGKNVFIGINVFFDEVKPELITIEDNVTILVGTTILTHIYSPYHFQKVIRQREAEVILKKFSYIGANAMIFPGVTIGEYSIIGAGAVVTKSIPAYSMALGVPAKVVKTFSPEDLK